jgi:hypothetical protein
MGDMITIYMPIITIITNNNNNNNNNNFKGRLIKEDHMGK